MQVQQVRRGGSTAVGTDVRPLVMGFLGLQLLLGYEWLMSGLSKLRADDFPGGLAATLSDMTQDQSGWYRSFVDGVVIPNAQLFGALVMVGELGLGTVLVVAALVGLTSWPQMGVHSRTIVLLGVALAALVGSFMSLNYHLAMGAPAPWTVSPDPNDQGVDLDSLMTVMQLVLAAASLRYLVAVRHPSPEGCPRP